MIRVADLCPVDAGEPVLPAASPAVAAPSSWFDEAPLPAPCIAAGLDAASRGLSVAQHAERVLDHLCREPADPLR
jgi:hypothetical protein